MSTDHSISLICAGKNRFGAPCTNPVHVEGDWCGRCSQRPEPPTTSTPVVEAIDTPPIPPPILAGPIPDESWTPAADLRRRLGIVAGGDPELMRLVEVCARLAANTRAESSKVAYRQHWSAFEKFGHTIGVPIAMPVATEYVCLFIGFLTHFRRVDPATGERDENSRPLSHGYLVQAVAAIGHRHRLSGHADPTDDPTVRALLEGYGKTYGTSKGGRSPIASHQLGLICEALSSPAATLARDLAVTLLATDSDIGLGPSQLAGLQPGHVLLPDRPLDPLILLVGQRGTSALRPVELWRNALTDICPVQALEALLPTVPPDAPSIFMNGDVALSREGVRVIADSAVSSARITDAAIERRLPRLDSDDRLRAAAAVSETPDLRLRDRAIVTNLYWGCFRGHELSGTRFHQLRFVDHGVEWLLLRTKNDQQGKGHTRGIPTNPDPWICPVTALTEWLARLERLHGRELAPDDPVFPSLRGPGCLSKPMSRDSVSDVVKRAASMAELVGDFGSHSPRIGFVTDAINHGSPREQIQVYGNWGSSKSLDPYYRKANIWTATNPAQRMTKWNPEE
jgi:integrase